MSKILIDRDVVEKARAVLIQRCEYPLVLVSELETVLREPDATEIIHVPDLVDLAKDAARYRWLRENVHREYARKSINPEFQDYNMKWMITPYLIATTAIDSDVPFDEAVDIAMEKRNENRS